MRKIGGEISPKSRGEKTIRVSPLINYRVVQVSGVYCTGFSSTKIREKQEQLILKLNFRYVWKAVLVAKKLLEIYCRTEIQKLNRRGKRRREERGVCTLFTHFTLTQFTVHSSQFTRIVLAVWVGAVWVGAV